MIDPCLDVLDKVYEFLNGELTEEEAAHVRVHLELCPPCLQQYAMENAVKRLLNRSCCQEQAPAALRIQIVARIREVRMTLRTDEEPG